MVIARKHLVDKEKSECFHLISRCVRRAYLCGDTYEHRKTWIEERIAYLSKLFAMHNLAFCVMSNHLHIAVKTLPQQAQTWSNREVAERWLMLYPRAVDEDENPCLPPEYIVDGYAQNEDWIEERRKRLSSLSWFMKCLKEPIAKRANAEDGCRGAFWEARFQSVKLLDQAALIACMAYIDLNPVRAQMCKIPEDSVHTSIAMRVDEFNKLQQEFSSKEQRNKTIAEHRWLASMNDCTVTDKGDLDAATPLTLKEYIRIVDETGRILRDGKRGSIDKSLQPILERLQVQAQNWITCMNSATQFTGTAIGKRISRSREAIERGLRCLMNKTALYGDDPPTP